MGQRNTDLTSTGSQPAPPTNVNSETTNDPYNRPLRLVPRSDALSVCAGSGGWLQWFFLWLQWGRAVPARHGEGGEVLATPESLARAPAVTVIESSMFFKVGAS